MVYLGKFQFQCLVDWFYLSLYLQQTKIPTIRLLEESTKPPFSALYFSFQIPPFLIYNEDDNANIMHTQ